MYPLLGVRTLFWCVYPLRVFVPSLNLWGGEAGADVPFLGVYAQLVCVPVFGGVCTLSHPGGGEEGVEDPRRARLLAPLQREQPQVPGHVLLQGAVLVLPLVSAVRQE